ncbi:MAG: 16S rRNA (uracil(1498)-N(3))-methyltransferase [Candidatus Pelagadaptatus aseana]|uniref:16S rRNA (uracil(1498)-N(3))-methyltransferase n=1 Tax=Candidatus Pelagadaptatus aseana TaxID=3120508 RepID=UPI0039B1B2C1
MRVPRIYTERPLQTGQQVELEAGPSHHITKVLRMGEGRSLILFNGTGGEFTGQIISASKKAVTVAIESFSASDRCSPLTIHLGVGLSKGDRFEWVLQKATELGVSQITPLFTERSEVKLAGDRLAKKLGHWQQIIISACEQCQLNRPPQLLQPQRFDKWLPTLTEQARFVLHHRSDQNLASASPATSVALAIGPEGGLSEQEIESALQQGFQPLTLGPRVFRTETAPLAAISVLQYLWGDLNSSKS